MDNNWAQKYTQEVADLQQDSSERKNLRRDLEALIGPSQVATEDPAGEDLMHEDDSQNQMADEYSAEMDANIAEGHHNRVINDEVSKHLMQPQGYFKNAANRPSKHQIQIQQYRDRGQHRFDDKFVNTQ